MLNYLIVEDFSGQETPFLFPAKASHEDMRNQLPYGKIVSAGVVFLGHNGFVCKGASPELGLTSRPVEDASILASCLQEQES